MPLPLRIPRLLTLAFALLATTLLAAPMSKPKVMLLTGQSSKYHDWLKSYPLVKSYLEQTGLFTVDVVLTPTQGADMSGFRPKFTDYAAVVMIYEAMNGPPPPRPRSSTT